MKRILFFLYLTVQCGIAQNYHYALDKASENSDVESPTSPLNLVASNITQTTTDLSWNMATDNVGVTLYRVYNNGNLISASTENSYILTGLIADTEYNLTVRAVDAAGNESTDSNTVSFTTSAFNNSIAGSTGADNIRFLIAGASNMQRTFSGNSASFMADRMTTEYPGKTFEAYNHGSAGQTICSFSEFVTDDMLAEYTNEPGTDTYVIIHLGGNDTTRTRPFGDLSQAYIDELIDCYEYMLDAIEAKGFIPIISDISFRFYDFAETNNAYDNEELGSKPYNDNIVIPLAESRTDFAYEDGEPFLQFYSTIYNDWKTHYDPYPNTDYIHNSAFSQKAFKDKIVFDIGNYIVNGIIPTKQNKIYVVDNEPPTSPTNLTLSNITNTSATLTWDESTDNEGERSVVYKIYQNDVLIDIYGLGLFDTDIIYEVTGLDTINNKYTFRVDAVDARGNESIPSNIARIGDDTSKTTSNLKSEQDIFDAFLYPLEGSSLAGLQNAIDTHGSVRLEAGDYGRGQDEITLSSNQKLFGHPTQTQIPSIHIEAGSTNVRIESIWANEIDFLPGAPITNSIFKSLKWANLNTVGGQIEDNLFLHINAAITFDCSTSGYIRNNRFYRQQIHGLSPQTVIKGNDATPSYGNVHAWINHLTPNGDAMIMENLDNVSIIGLDAEGWNLRQQSTKNALVYMRDIGDVRIADFAGANGYCSGCEVPAFDIEADKITFINKGIANVAQRYNTPILSIADSDVFAVGALYDRDRYQVQNGINISNQSRDWNDPTGTYNEYSVYIDGQEQTTTLTDPTTINTIKDIILPGKKPAYPKPIFETLPDPLGANWMNERDGKPDSTAYIQGLINANSVAELPEGVFYISSTLNIDGNDAIKQGIVGSGTGKTVICGLTDDFPLITVYNSDDFVTNVNLSHVTLQGGSVGLYFPTEINLITNNLWKYVVFRNQEYGILTKRVYGLDNNFLDHINFVDCNYGFFNEGFPSEEVVGNKYGYVDKTTFYKSQFINCGVGASPTANRGCNLNLWLDCKFEGNQLALNLHGNIYPMVINSVFSNNTGGGTRNVVVQGGDMSLYSCDFIGNTAPNILSSKKLFVEGCNFLDSATLCSGDPHHFQQQFILNSTINASALGGGGIENRGTYINNSFPSEPALNKLYVNDDNNKIITIIDEPSNPYPQLLIKK